MSNKKGHRVHFEPTAASSSLPSVTGSSKAGTAVKVAPEQVVKLHHKPLAPKQDNKRLTSCRTVSREARTSATAKPSKGKAKKLFTKAEWDKIWSGMLCIECFKMGKEVRGLSKDHPQHVTEDVSGTARAPSLTQVAREDPESLAKDKGKHSVKSAAIQPEAPEQVVKLHHQAEPWRSQQYEEEDETILWDNKKGWKTVLDVLEEAQGKGRISAPELAQVGALLSVFYVKQEPVESNEPEVAQLGGLYARDW